MSGISAEEGLRTTSDVLALAAAALPPPFGLVARILSAAAGAASVAVAGGQTEAQVVASIRRVTAIDVAGQDAAIDARLASLPTAEMRSLHARANDERTERGDEITREIPEGHVGRSAIADATREPTREIPPDLSLGPRPR